MDIFITNINDSKKLDKSVLNEFQDKKIHNTKKQIQHSFSYLMLDRILKDVYKITEYELVFINKKPYLKNREKYISLSHSEDYAAICFSDNECGIDIEKMTERNFKKISERKNFVAETAEDFYKNWTLYEAEYKLASEAKSHKHIQFKDYMLTAVSDNINEEFIIYIQVLEDISKSQK